MNFAEHLRKVESEQALMNATIAAKRLLKSVVAGDLEITELTVELPEDPFCRPTCEPKARVIALSGKTRITIEDL
jgi:hypothetical protein